MVSITAKDFVGWAPVVIRIALGTIFLAHGGQKLFGLWGGSGLAQTMEDFQKYMGIPPYLTAAAALTEFFGGLAVLAGLFTRLACAGLGIVMLVAIYKAHWVHGFFINWALAAGKGHGIEFNLALLAMCLAILLSGPGRLALDRLLGMERE